LRHRIFFRSPAFASTDFVRECAEFIAECKWSPRSRRQQEPVMVRRIATFAWGSLLSLCVASTAFAETPGHPRVNQINQRVTSQQSRITAGVARGQLGPSQAHRDAVVEARISRQLSRDEALHDGHVTPVEQLRLDRELDRNSIRIYDQRQ
jgi:hypothetical protein